MTSVRVFAALLVIIGHSFELGGRLNFGVQGDPMRTILGTETLAGCGVIMFFAISGYVVSLSALRSQNVLDFLWKRLVRIVPAFWVITVVSVFFWGPALTTLPLLEYFASRDVHDYMMSLFFKLSQFLPGVFATNPITQGFNGSLWTLPLELKCYLMVAVMSLFGRTCFRVALILGLAAMVFTIWYVLQIRTLKIPIFREEARLFIKLVAPFLMGAAVALFPLKRWLSPGFSVFMVIAVSAISFAVPSFQKYGWLVIAVAVAYATLSIVLHNEKNITSHDNRTDLSYGLYLWAFPIQQTLLSVFPSISTLVLLVVTLIIVFPIAIASWRYVERPMLKEKNRVGDFFRKRQRAGKILKQGNLKT